MNTKSSWGLNHWLPHYLLWALVYLHKEYGYMLPRSFTYQYVNPWPADFCHKTYRFTFCHFAKLSWHMVFEILPHRSKKKYLYYNINSSAPGQNGHHYSDDIFKCIFLNDNVRILIKISLNFVANVWINNIPPLVQIMAWHQPGAKTLAEPMMVTLLMHICITLPQCVNTMFAEDWESEAEILKYSGPSTRRFNCIYDCKF